MLIFDSLVSLKLKNIYHIIIFNKILSAPDEKTRKAEKPLKEGLLFDCTYRISLGKEEYKEEKAIGKMQVKWNIIQIAYRTVSNMYTHPESLYYT